MKSESRSILSMIGVALLIAFGVAAQAQNREKFVISAKAGGVNLVSGNVTVQRKDVQRPEALTANDNLEMGDSVTTGAGGRVEVLLNPGTYLRVDENSEFQLTDASLDNLRVKLVKGSALVEATGDDETTLSIGFTTPQTEALIVKRGIYRFNILPNAMTEIAVRKGRAFYGAGVVNVIKGGQKVLIGNGQAEVTKWNKKDEDAFDLWSKQRASCWRRRISGFKAGHCSRLLIRTDGRTCSDSILDMALDTVSIIRASGFTIPRTEAIASSRMA